MRAILSLFLLLFATLPSGANAQTAIVGYVDAHSHLMAHEAFGGQIVCGRPYDEDGPEVALTDCADHYPNGSGAWLENLTRYGSPVGSHDPVGWPTFRDWPAHNSYTHQQVYHEWLERAWRGGLRLMVHDLVANRQLCEMYPFRHNSCDEMASLRLQAKRTFELQAYIDSLHGGAGQGWFRVVLSPAEARSVIAAGKLAVVLGVEASEPFGCRKTVLDLPLCTPAQIRAGLDELYGLGVRSMFLCHKFDNALCGVRFDSGALGAVLNVGNLLSSGSFWQTRSCDSDAHDHAISPNGVLPAEIASLIPPGLALPVYPPAPHCNARGLTSLGRYALNEMMARDMIVELDHMSVRAADATLSILEANSYPGVVSSHSWIDPSFLERIYQLGGFVAAYGSEADQFASGWQGTRSLRQRAGVYGYGYGLDANGMGRLPGPRVGVAKVTYPFTTVTGLTMTKLHFGQRTWDLNIEGVANYGLVPDWLEDLRLVGGQELADEMAAGAESYIRTWEAID